MAVVEGGDEQREEVRTATELDVLLERLADEARAESMPQDVQLTVEGAGTLCRWSVMTGASSATYRATWTRRTASVWEARDSDDPVVFYVAGDNYSEALRRNTIPPTAARDAMRHFLTTGALSPEVEWEQV